MNGFVLKCARPESVKQSWLKGKKERQGRGGAIYALYDDILQVSKCNRGEW
jgi:hypothetical protein